MFKIVFSLSTTHNIIKVQPKTCETNIPSKQYETKRVFFTTTFYINNLDLKLVPKYYLHRDQNYRSTLGPKVLFFILTHLK